MSTIITLAAGCFWGTQAYFDRQFGVIKTTVGYGNGNQSAVTYEEVCQNKTEFVEACQIEFDESKISLELILEKFWSVIDPTIINQQGNDVGTQYRTGIYYNQADEKWILPIIQRSMAHEAQKYQKSIVTEVLPLDLYVIAEEYHQKYLESNPGGYCHIDLSKA